MTRRILALVMFTTGLAVPAHLSADQPVASYVFPAGGQRGKDVEIRLGGLFLHEKCGFRLDGPGVTASPTLTRTATPWFEGPVIPQPASQRAEDYPKDMRGRVTIATDAVPGVRLGYVTTSQGIAGPVKFVIGELPEVIETEVEGEPVPVAVAAPVTINGRIFPREDVDIWAFAAKAGKPVTLSVDAARIGSPLEARLEITDEAGRRITEGNLGGDATDPIVRFIPPADGTYHARIHDINFVGGPAYVYRLTITDGAFADRVFPLGGRRGTTLHAELSGQNLPSGPVAIALPADALSPFTPRLDVRPANVISLDLDDLPEMFEADTDDDPAKLKPITGEAVLNGRIDPPGDTDRFAVSLTRGENLSLDLRAARLGSPLYGTLTVSDIAGKELARGAANPQGPGGPIDPVLRWIAPADGTYLVTVGEQFHKRGGPSFAYRLRLTRAKHPDFRLALSLDNVTVTKGEDKSAPGQPRPPKLRVTVDREFGFKETIQLAAEGLPKGVTFTPTVINPNQAAVDLTFNGDMALPVKLHSARIVGTATLGEADAKQRKPQPKKGKNDQPEPPPPLGPTLQRVAAVPGRGHGEMLVHVAVPTPFKVVGEFSMMWAPAGTQFTRTYKLERNGFTGPLEVSLSDRQMRHLQGVTGPTITVPAEAEEFNYTVRFPPWMEKGRTSRTCVMAVGVVKDADGTEHKVSYHSVHQNEQIVVVIEPGPLSVTLGRTSVLAVPGQSESVPVKVSRGLNRTGPVKLEVLVPGGMKGVTAAPVIVPADKDEATVTLTFAAPCGPFLMPAVIKATLSGKDGDVVAEEKLELVGE